MHDDRKKKSVLVSICCMTYNHENFIKDCIEGLIKQKTDFDYEILIHEDASRDNTSAVVREYEKKYPELIKVIYQTENQFLKQHILSNLLLPMAKGKYIALCEGDDYWNDSYKLQKQVDFLEANDDVVITGHDAFIINKKGEKIKDSKLPEIYKRDASGNDLKKMFWILTLSMVFRNIPDVLTDFKEVRESKNGDSCLTSILGNYGNFHYHEDINPAAYRLHQDGVWSVLANEKKIKQHIITFKILLNFYRLKQDTEMVRFYKEKIDQKMIQRFDYAMNNSRLIRKTELFYKTLILNNNWKRRDRLVYLHKAYFKSLITSPRKTS